MAEEMLTCGTPRAWGETEPGDLVVIKKDGDGTDRALAKAEAVGGQSEHHALRTTDLSRGFFSLGEITAADQQRHIGVSGAQVSCRRATDHA